MSKSQEKGPDLNPSCNSRLPSNSPQTWKRWRRSAWRSGCRPAAGLLRNVTSQTKVLALFVYSKGKLMICVSVFQPVRRLSRSSIWVSCWPQISLYVLLLCFQHLEILLLKGAKSIKVIIQFYHHHSVWPAWGGGGGARLRWLSMVLPVCDINKLFNW